MKRFNPTQLLQPPKPPAQASSRTEPTCRFCLRSGTGVSFAVFNPRFKPFGTVCTDCEATLPEGTTVADAARLAPWSHRPAPPPVPMPAEVEARRRDDERLRAERDAKFIAFCGQPGAPLVEIPDGMMAVTLSLKYDNSDSMTDYFDRHASLGPEFLVLLVKKQAQTERLARKALAQASLGRPELSLDGWKWKTEKYSMGHGNYLTSGGFSLPETLQGLETHYRGGQVTNAHWEIEFTCGGRYGRPLHPHASYGRKAAPAFSSEPATSRMTVTATQHTKHGYPIWVVQLADRVDRPEFERLRDVCKSLGGWYSSYRGHGAIPGFTFKDEASAKAFAMPAAPSTLNQESSTTPAPDPEAELRALWRAKGIPPEQQAAIVASVTAAAQPGAKVCPFTIPVMAPAEGHPSVTNIVPVNFAPPPPPAPRPNPMLRRLQRPC